ncbi:MAG: AEC family transporter [Lachnospiraceae bacterium]|nr:AEC family transporter [Lachnospiraceae bacterium]
MSLSIILQQMGVICILVAIGIYLQKRGVADSLTTKNISTIVVDICNPALILASILSGNITATHRDLLIAAGLGAALYAILVALGFLLPHILRVAPDKRRFYNLMTVYTNTGFLGIPIAKAVLPSNAILYVIVVNVFYSLLFYTHGLAILGSGRADEDGNPVPVKASLRSILNPGTIMALLSLAVFWFEISLPPILANTVSYVGNATVFLSMALLGINIARSKIGTQIRDARIWAYIALRMVLVPSIVVLVMYVCRFDPAATLAMCLMAAVPVGNLPMIQAEKIGEDTTILSSAIAVTTAVSMGTITALILAFSALLL